MVRFAEAAASLAEAPATYHSLYENVDWRDARFGEQARVYALFSSTDEATWKTGAALYDEVKRTWDEMPQVYVSVTKEVSPLVFFHRAMVFPQAMGNPTQREWNDKVVMFKMDVVGAQAPQAVYLPAKLFDVIGGNVKVHPWINYVTHYTGNDGADVPHEAVPADAPDSVYDNVQVRHGVYLPPQVASLFCRSEVTVGQLIVHFNTYLETLPEEQRGDFGPLKDWLRVVGTAGGRARVERSTLPQPVNVDSEVLSRLVAVVNADLPGWNRRAAAPAPSTAERTPATGNDTNVEVLRVLAEIMAAQLPQGRADEADTTKRPSSKWKLTLGTLLRLTRCETEDQLPELYGAMANAGKSEKIAVLQSFFDKAGSELKCEVPLATTEIWSTLERLEFRATSDYVPERGINPFMVLAGDDRHTAMRRQAEEHQMLLEGGANAAQLSDVRELRKSKTLTFPTTEKYTRKTLEAFAVLLSVVAGRNSAVFMTFKRDIVDGFRGVEERLHTLNEAHGGMGLIYLKYLFAIRSELQDYWERCNETPAGHVDVPRFADLQSNIRRVAWTPPTLPMSYLPAGQEVALAQRLANPAVSHAGTRSNPISLANSPTSSGATSPGPQPDKNLAADPALLALGGQIGKLKTFLKDIAPVGAYSAAPPRLANGKEACLSWHSKGQCYPGCARQATHAPLNAADKAALLAFFNNGIALKEERDRARRGGSTTTGASA